MAVIELSGYLLALNGVLAGRHGVSRYVNLWDLKGKVLVVAEKPKAARKIAEALSDGFLTRRYNNIPYYEIVRGGLHVIIASAAGHLYTLHTDTADYPVFKYLWIPAYLADKDKKHTKTYLDLLNTLFRTCQYYVNACDYDIEGSVIGYLLIKFHGDEGRALRAKFSSLTHHEIRASLARLTPLDYNMIEAGLCRHELDWVWGINISRALMKAVYMYTKKRISLSAGRVQTPTLKYIVNYSIKKNMFVPLPQYSVSVILEVGGKRISAEFAGNPLTKKSEANEIKHLVESSEYLIVKDCNISSQKIHPPPPFNLSDLQAEAARIYGFSPLKTQEIAEQLYLDALISYPRTNSQKLPPMLNYGEILGKIAKISGYGELVKELLLETKSVLKPIEGEKEDPAHPAIYPTGVAPRKLTREQAAIYDLIVRRFLAAFATPAVISHVKITFTTPNGLYAFETTGLNIEWRGWMGYYPFHKPSTKAVPMLKPGEKLRVKAVSVREAYTKPPPKLKKIDVLKWMENVGIGTESTRAIIVEKLFERGYLKNTKMGIEVSDLGIGIVEVVERFFPDLASVELTRSFEVLMNDILRGAKRKDEVLEEAKRVISDLLLKFDTQVNGVGLLLAKKLSLINDYERCSIPDCRGDRYKNGMCKIHYLAYETMSQKYEEWKQRVNASFNEYVSRIAKMKSTGKYVKDIIEHYILKRAERG